MSSETTKTIHTLIAFLKKNLAAIYSHNDEQQQVAWWMMEAVTGKSQAELIASDIFKLTHDQEKKLAQWIDQHVNEKKPLQYIIGSVPFNEITLSVNPPILIPRPETEEWTVNLIAQLKKINAALDILDIGTGSGAIAIALAKHLKKSHIYATDIDNDALALAQKNAHMNTISTITFIKSDVFDAIPRHLKFDLIVSNPPYISDQEWKYLDPMVTEWEDKKALVAGGNGLAIIKKIINQAPAYLKPNNELFEYGIAQLYIEIGFKQAQAVSRLMQEAGYTTITVVKDLEGKDRVVTGRIS